MKKQFAWTPVFGLITLLAAGMGCQREPEVDPAEARQEILDMDWRQLHRLAGECERGEREDRCTLIFEVLALKAQHARQGESFWIRQMGRLGDWHLRVAAENYESGQPEPEEFQKALDVSEWILENKPFQGARALRGMARYHDALGNPDEARRYTERLVQRFPDSPYAEAFMDASAEPPEGGQE
jgi:hypothetical protein